MPSTGIEPVNLRSLARRSHQLSYAAARCVLFHRFAALSALVIVLLTVFIYSFSTCACNTALKKNSSKTTRALRLSHSSLNTVFQFFFKICMAGCNIFTP